MLLTKQTPEDAGDFRRQNLWNSPAGKTREKTLADKVE
jgi:hypothetical protein